MSLDIGVRVYDTQSGQWVWIELDAGYQLMGFEVFRQQLWGTEIMKALGLELLPSLGDGAYLVIKTPDDITRLENEAHLIRANLNKLREVLGPDKANELEKTYLPNIINAIAVARSAGGEITIG